jgi:serine phosphatase RsbU (regulator of sigma subunit)
VPVGTVWRPSRVAAVAFLSGLLLTAALVVTSSKLYDRNEQRLLDLRDRQLGLVLTAAIPPTQTPLATGAALADATGGSPQRFRAFMAPEVGTGRQFDSASLWRLSDRRPTPIATVGPAPTLTRQEARKLFTPHARPRLLTVFGRLQTPIPSIGYEFSTPGVTRGYAVYAERRLPKTRRSRLERNSAFSDLDYAIYLGRSPQSANLLVTSLTRLPITDRKASEIVPFGDNSLTLVVTPRGSLGGAFFHRLPWIVAVLGFLVTAAAALMTDRLARGRQRAERLAGTLDQVAGENARMYAEQRSIAQTLQHALLPDALPEVQGLRVSARYVPAASGVEVGGDWYDVLVIGEHRVLLVIGDVSGHGLTAATTMASLRHATLAYAAQDARPGAVLTRLSDFVNSGPHDYFATALCAIVDVENRRITLASAGHLPPLILAEDGGHFIDVDANVPIGVARSSNYQEANVPMPPNATMIAFTDGLVERRGESLDTGLARLRDAAMGGRRLPLEDLVAKLPADLAVENHHDDTAIVAIQWQS